MEEKNYKRIHPQHNANILSKLFFCWLFPTFAKGFQKPLTEDNLYDPLDDHESSKLGDKLETAWKVEACKTNPSLWRALTKVFGATLAFYGLIYLLIEFSFRLVQPLLISRLMSYYTPNQTHISKEDAYIYAGSIVVAQFCNVLATHYYMLALLHLGMKIRVASCSLIYRKALKLSHSSLAETTVGQMVNLLSNDVSRFDISVIHIHNMWLAPLETIIVMYLMCSYVGTTALTGVVFLVMFIPLQIFMGKRTSTLRSKTAVRTDERVRQMNEIVSGIQVIKMYTWEKPFAKLVELSRRNEMKQIRSTSNVRALTVSFTNFVNCTAVYLCVLTYILSGNRLNHQYVFVVIAFYAILKQTLTILLPRGITFLAETIVSVSRIRTFLMREEINNSNLNECKLESNSSPEKKSIGIDVQNATVKWLASSPDNTLNNIYVNIGSKQLVAVIGPVGSGKSTFLHTILEELPILNGTIDTTGSISYASQEPWLFGGNIRENIVFGQELDLYKYEKVIRVCALERDFLQFQYADRTLVGERGVMLSGGQKARINLARAIYKDADIYLLDDPLSSVDALVGKQIFDECICGYLKGKCVVLVTHQLQYLRKVDSIYLMKNGTITASGSYNEIQKNKADFLSLLEERTEDNEGNNRSKNIKNVNIVQNAKEPAKNQEQKSVGKISGRIYSRYLKSGGSWFKIVGIIFVFLLSQICASGTDYFLTFWVNLEQKRQLSGNLNSTTSEKPANDTHIPNYLLSIFQPDLSENNYNMWIYLYTTLVLLVITLTLLRSFSFFKFCMTASTNLHNSMLKTVLHAKMIFFNNNDSGRILNRFSKDMGSIDEVLPITMIDTIQIGLIAFAISILVASVNPWVLVPTVIIVSIFYIMRLVFLTSSRELKRMEATTRSPVFSYLSSSLSGLATIRAFNAQSIMKTEFDNRQNLHSSAYYLFLAANRTFGFWLDMHCVFYTALVTLSFLFIEHETYGGNVGLAITQALELVGMFQWGIRQWSELENQMTSVERVVEYTELNVEGEKVSDQIPQKNFSNLWPKTESIRFDSVSLRYSPDKPNVLENINFVIQDKEKIGIVGRTGAGKSSLINALFLLFDINNQVFIDQINTKEIPLSHLRSKISIIPQEPVLFSGPLRKNIDPFDEHTEETLWKCLEEVELKSTVNDLSLGLDHIVSEGGSNFSVGQRQLLCLARALIRKNKILILDEATANVDPCTDSLIRLTIRKNFSECTVLTIAHRIQTIMDSDRVIVMDAGRVVEFDTPKALLEKSGGIFYELAKQTGSA